VRDAPPLPAQTAINRRLSCRPKASSKASKREAEAQVILAEASQKSIDLVTSAVGDKELPVAYLLGEKYIASLQNLSSSDNSKFVVFPADIPAAIKGMMGAR
jgi:regulator of protease activity HflC (stomatin/prohibitin superfamily)